METQRVSIETAGKGSDQRNAHQTPILFPGVHVKRQPKERRWREIISRVKKIKTLRGNDFLLGLQTLKSKKIIFKNFYIFLGGAKNGFKSFILKKTAQF